MKHEIQVPFTGFYESVHGWAMDSVIDRELDEFPDLDYEDIKIDWQGFVEDYSREYLACFEAKVKEETDLDISLEFVELDSPKEYNFRTDIIVAKISERDIQRLMCWHTSNDSLQMLTKVIREMFTSCDGFISFYNPNIVAWKVLTAAKEWDEVQLGALLRATCPDFEELYPDNGSEIAYNHIETPTTEEEVK